MRFFRKHSSQNNLFRVTLRNSSTGQGLTGLTSASAGLIIALTADNEATATMYTVTAGNVETITTLGTFAAPSAGKCRFKEVDATNHPGLYELQFLDTRFSVASARQLNLSITGAASLLGYDSVIQLTAKQVADGNVESDVLAISGDATAADNLELATDGGSYNVGGGAVVAASVTGAVGSVTGAVGSVTGAVGSVTGSVGSVAGNVSGSVASVTGAVGSVTGAVGSVAAAVTVGTNNDKIGYSLTQAFPTNFASMAITVGGLVSADTVVTVTGNVDGSTGSVVANVGVGFRCCRDSTGGHVHLVGRQDRHALHVAHLRL